MYKKEFDTSYVGFMKDGAQWLVDNTDVKLVGKISYYLFSCEPFVFHLVRQSYIILIQSPHSLVY